MFALTTMRQQPRVQGLTAVELLQDRVDAPDGAPAQRVLPSELVVRASTAAPRA
jgi:DNA-binding LacI/PurR family transcriptional regulator